MTFSQNSMKMHQVFALGMPKKCKRIFYLYGVLNPKTIPYLTIFVTLLDGHIYPVG